MFKDINLNARGRMVVGTLKSLGTAAVVVGSVYAGWMFLWVAR